MRSLFFYLAMGLLMMLPELVRHWQALPAEHALQQHQLAVMQSEKGTDAVKDEQKGIVKIAGSYSPLTETMVQQAVSKRSEQQSSYISIWNWQGIEAVTASARGLDSQHHFANSYLVGFQPFETEALWVPLYTLAVRKEYQYDHLQYAGLADIWQTSRQAYYQKRGDCEDHAILLADWLINLGVDARVALGTYKGEGHAWVVAIVDNTEYLLEATSKRRQASWQAMPLAALTEGYEVEFQFNRDYFWAKTTAAPTRRYRGDHWIRKSQFIRG
ncbi:MULTISPECIES: transglutaminase-like domain-containing protein [Microbulbifer]|uniref:transglutaminase-like domain-containing protein n=1 Tax=Microbulbifer TaxID=48073 RepID=UPI001CD268C8|nr:transglutaminase-like domain-containing protein [Microbulbifer agarilyticus]MCA0900431.1 transglutaminase-like domain-containing protein [Microbulbifer agarilyticus]